MRRVAPPFLSLLFLLAGCHPGAPSGDEVLCETVHRYGMPLDPQDWSARGQDGQIVSVRKDGANVTRSYEGGILHGECTYTFPYRKAVQKREVYERGVLIEEFLYYPGGNPQQHIFYASPGCESITVWYENGVPQCREERRDGLLVQGEYYTPTHQLESRVEECQGTQTRRGALGQLESIDTIEAGQRVLRATYYPNGMPAALTPYVDGAVEGYRRTFSLGGEPVSVEEWHQNLQHGTTLLFEQGDKWAEVPYVKGCKQGVERRYGEDGETVVQEITWVEGCQHGPTRSHVGSATRTDWFFRGSEVPNKATFDMLCNQ